MKRVALFVGVDEYEDRSIVPLAHAVDDAEELAAVFRRQLCFDRVEKLRNPSGRKDILRKVKELTSGLGKGDLMFFFFAGHGFTVNDNHMLVCSEDEYDLLYEGSDGLPVGILKKRMSGPWNRMLVIDACQNDIRKKRGEDEGMSARDLALILEDRDDCDGDFGGEGTQVVVTSCDEGQKALEVEELGHGLFTSAMLETVTDHARARRRLDVTDFCSEMEKRMGLLAGKYRVKGKQNPLFKVPGGCSIVLLEGEGTVASGQPPGGSGQWEEAVKGELCETCGRYRPLTDLFKCRGCGKWHCAVHQDQETWLCPGCAESKRTEADFLRRAEEEARKREREEARQRQAAAEAARKAREEASRRTGNWGGSRWGRLTDEWNVRLVESGPLMLGVIKEIRAITGLGLKESKDFVLGTPANVKENVSRDEAERIKKQLEAAGARVEITASGGEEQDDGNFQAGDDSQTREWRVRLVEVGPMKISVIKGLRDVLDIGLMEARDFVEGAPQIVADHVTRLQAERIKQSLEAVGARVVITDGTGETKRNDGDSQDLQAMLDAKDSGRREGETKTIVLPGGAKMEFAWCPPGMFVMGDGIQTDDGYYEYDYGVPWVTLTKGFWMAKTPVTQRQWKSVMGSNPSEFKGDDLPVENVSWNASQEFCKKVGLRLPTEAEWEYACRAGTMGPYGGTERLEEMGWFDENSGGKTHPVGQKAPNAWGLFDMHGNVWEWCADWYGPYEGGDVTDPEGGDVTDPKGAVSGTDRVLRGGGWNSDRASGCCSSSRGSYDPGGRDNDTGFRPCLSAGLH